MARKTKAELTAERLAYEAAQRAEQVAAYPARLMAALEEATVKNNYDLTVKNGMFSLRDRDANTDLTLSLTMSYTENSWNALESLEWDLEQYADERANRQRRAALKSSALSKLSNEEREVLGL